MPWSVPSRCAHDRIQLLQRQTADFILPWYHSHRIINPLQIEQVEFELKWPLKAVLI